MILVEEKELWKYSMPATVYIDPDLCDELAIRFVTSTLCYKFEGDAAYKYFSSSVLR